jgi:hypothetical protein
VVARGDTAAAEDGADEAAEEAAGDEAAEAGAEETEEAEETGEEAGADDVPPDEHPAAAATTAPAATAPPSLSSIEAVRNITNHPFLMTGMSARARRESAASGHPTSLRRHSVRDGWREITSVRGRGNRVI